MLRRLVVCLLALALATGLTSCATSVKGSGSLPDPHDAVLQTKDLPSWNESRTPDENDPQGDAQFSRCAGTSGSDDHVIASADSPDFDQGETATVSSSVDLVRTPADVRSDLKLILAPRFAACVVAALRAEFAKSLPAGAHVDRLDLAFRKRTAAEPPRLAAFGRTTIVVSVSGRRLRFYLDFALVAGLRMEGTVTFFHTDKPFPPNFEWRVMDFVAARLA